MLMMFSLKMQFCPREESDPSEIPLKQTVTRSNKTLFFVGFCFSRFSNYFSLFFFFLSMRFLTPILRFLRFKNLVTLRSNILRCAYHDLVSVDLELSYCYYFRISIKAIGRQVATPSLVSFI